MATVEPRRNKEGKITSFRFTACLGRNADKKQNVVHLKVDVPDGFEKMSATKAKKAIDKLQQQADEWEQKLKAGLIPAKVKTFKSFVDDDFIPIHLAEGKVSPSTREFYKNILNKITPKLGNLKLDSIRSIDIEKFLTDLQTEKRKDSKGNEASYAPGYVKHFRTVLTVCFRFAENHGMIERNPMNKVSSIREEHKDVDFLSKKEASDFLNSLKENADSFWNAAMYTFIFTGVRRGELAGLQWKDFDFENNTVTIDRDVINCKETNYQNVIKPTKTAQSDRVLPLPDCVVVKLKAWQNEQKTRYDKLFPTAYVFNAINDPYEPIRPHSITQWLNRYNKRYGFRNVSPHDLRHTCASLMLDAGATVKEVQNIMGHGDASTTLKFYTGANLDGKRNASNKLAEALSV